MKPVVYFLFWVTILTLQFICLWDIGDKYGDECFGALIVFAMIDFVLFNVAEYYGVVKK